MADLPEREAYSSRDDPDVPSTTDTGPIAVMDGDCALCSWGARRIAQLDGCGAFRICPICSPTGSALVEHFGLAPVDPETWLFLEDGRA